MPETLTAVGGGNRPIIDCEIDGENVIIYDLLLNRQMAISQEQAKTLAFLIGAMFEDKERMETGNYPRGEE